jgi:MurNAc alpha-1-phosphate uridylyltransferase
MKVDGAMIFAAGLGTRMGDLTKTTPKPMLQVAGRPLIDCALNLADDLDLSRVVVNLHYLPEQLRTHLRGRKNVETIEEKNIVLETGGGLKNALPLLGDGPVFTLNSDAIWTGENPLRNLLSTWNPDKMDALLMLVPRENAQEHRGVGDFNLLETGRITRRGTADSAPYVYTGAQIVKPKLLADIPETVFSLNLLWDRFLKAGRAYGVVHHGGWVDVGTPHGIDVAEAEIARVQNV